MIFPAKSEAVAPARSSRAGKKKTQETGKVAYAQGIGWADLTWEGHKQATYILMAEL